jgi:hypothetical protein
MSVDHRSCPRFFLKRGGERLWRRRGELVDLEVRDLDLHPDGTGQALIRRGKTDAEGQGKDGVSLARDGEVAQGVAGARGYNTGAGISASNPSGSALKSGTER